jgi:hypothetical protein
VTLDFLGIARERVYSPGKVDDDRAILDAVAARLGTAYRVAVISADQPLPREPPAGVVFAMCQGPAALDTLRRWEAAAVRVINSSAGIANTHRARMLAAFAQHRIAQPLGLVLRTDDAGALPEWVDGGAWLKRGDVHATEPDDVVRVEHRAGAAAALAALRALAAVYEESGFRRKAAETLERALAAVRDDAARVELRKALVRLIA